MKMLTDNPIHSCVEDAFGFSKYAKILSDAIIDTGKLPFCIGVFGAWGTGKSSLMKMIEEYTNEENSIKSVWFNPWKYDKKEDLWHALIQTILYKIAEDQNPEIQKKAKDLASYTAWLLIKKGLSSITGGIVSDEMIDNAKETILKQDELYYRHINHFENDFAEVVNLYTNNGKLVVLIDDLDRCIPENAITVLESLKLFIGDARCVFVLGMDHCIVEEGIKIRYGNYVNLSGRDYLDKIIQVPFFLPPVPFDKLRESLQVTKTANYSKIIWELLKLGFEGNPRKTKRFVNCFYFLRKLIVSSQKIGMTGHILNVPISSEVQDYYLTKLLIFQISYPEFYSYLIRYPDAWLVYENKLLKAANLEKRKEILEERNGLDHFWNNETLKNFMTLSSHNDVFPEPPESTIVISLCQMTNLVDTENKQQLAKE